jgi:hypothetical protein
MLMGGTGVGKSTLLNALAGGPVAQASFARPTTRDPVVYYHESITPHRLDPLLQQCRLAVHDRPALEHKIIVDTPDLDSNDLANRDKLNALLPVADIVLYVGSQEKYHDKLGWDLFLNQRKRRAFAFVLNKWDRCQHPNAGMRPDEDLLRDLKAEGFESPLLFRTCAQYWVDRAEHDGATARRDEGVNEKDGTAQPVASSSRHAVTPPEGEQFQELVNWLEAGLTRLEIDAIKARGVSQLLRQLQQAVEKVRAPDLGVAAERTQNAWARILHEEALANAEVLLTTLEPYQKEIEHHFALERQRQFGGIMGSYLHWFNRLKYTGSTLRERIPFLPRLSQPVQAPAEWDLGAFTRACAIAASERQLDSRGKALANRLLLEADRQGFPLSLLSQPTEAVAKLDWQPRYAQALIDVLGKVEHEWSRPTGTRRWLQRSMVILAEWVPLLAFGVMATVLLMGYMNNTRTFTPWDLLLPPVVVFMVLIILHVLIALLLPLRWLAIRAEFERELKKRLRRELESAYAQVPLDVAEVLRNERGEVDRFLGEIRDVAGWLERREQSASIVGLYGR